MSKKATKTAKPKPAAKPAVGKADPEPRAKRNGITQPAEGSLCRKVWDTLDKLTAQKKDTTFEAVRELAGDGMADATVRTQRQRWREYNGITREPKKARKPGTPKQAAAPAEVSEVQTPAA